MVLVLVLVLVDGGATVLPCSAKTEAGGGPRGGWGRRGCRLWGCVEVGDGIASATSVSPNACSSSFTSSFGSIESSFQHVSDHEESEPWASSSGPEGTRTAVKPSVPGAGPTTAATRAPGAGLTTLEMRALARGGGIANIAPGAGLTTAATRAPGAGLTTLEIRWQLEKQLFVQS